ncbi:hypothetical protein NMG29_19280, partial [Streptomyces cocklensis]|nr:hypothetical protein [Actinacidiphila cocklensis]
MTSQPRPANGSVRAPSGRASSSVPRRTGAAAPVLPTGEQGTGSRSPRTTSAAGSGTRAAAARRPTRP